VKILDANLLLYAYDSDSLRHREAKKWLEGIFSQNELIGLPWQSALAFLRVMSDTRLPGRRLTIDEAVEIVETWAELPQVRFLSPGADHWRFLRQMLITGDAKGRMGSDAELAALTVEYGGVLYSNDRDFARFPGLRWVNPLES
jgi:hypothetical protein